MKTKIIIKYFMVVATIGILFTSCRKKEEDNDKDTSSAVDNALAEGTFNDANNIADQGSTGTLSSFSPTLNNNGDKGLLSACATITVQNANNLDQDTFHVSFGTAPLFNDNCLCSDGRYRKGTIDVVYTGNYIDSGSTHTISFTNYFVNDNQVLGTKTVTNNGHNSAGHLSFSISVNGTIIKASGGGTVTWVSSRTREWIIGESTPLNWGDDVYLITGSASGTTASGATFNANITNPIRKEMACHYLVSGTIEITPSGKPVRTIDFGTGACDNQATCVINGNTYTINMH